MKWVLEETWMKQVMEEYLDEVGDVTMGYNGEEKIRVYANGSGDLDGALKICEI